MSFSVTTKNELARIVARKQCCQLAELAALVKLDGLIQISGRQKLSLHLITETAAVARKVFSYLKNIFAIHTDVLIKKKSRLKKNNVYVVRMTSQPGVNRILKEIGFINEQGQLINAINSSIVQKDCCKRSFLRGAFLGGGSVSNPEGDYHLEILINDEEFSQFLCELLEVYNLRARINHRKNWEVVYLKGSEDIIKLLNLMGAHSALLDFENTRIYKDMRNQVNRLVNCETANLNKTVDAALKQIEDIKLIQETIGFDNLADNLRIIAELRLQYPDISLKELGEMLSPPIGKSGVNHRIRRIQKIADKIRENQNSRS